MSDGIVPYAVKAYQHLYRQSGKSMTYADFVDDVRDWTPDPQLDSVVAYMTRCDWVVLWQDSNDVYWISINMDTGATDTTCEDGGGGDARSSSSEEEGSDSGGSSDG